MHAILKYEYKIVCLQDREKMIQLLVDRAANLNAQDQVIRVVKIECSSIGERNH